MNFASFNKPMTFVKATTWKERGLQMIKIRDKCNSIIKKLSLPDNDVRVQGLIHIRQFCVTIVQIPLALQHQYQNPKNHDLLAKILLFEDPKDLGGIFTDFNKNSKIAFITLVQFAFENSIKAILEAKGESAPESFYEAAKRIIEISQIADPDQKRRYLLIPANIRNALHRNGIHTKPDIPAINIDGAIYEFIQGHRLNCGLWSHLFHILLQVLEIYEEIFTSQAIRSVQYIDSN